MTDIENDLFYLCSLIEYTARVTKNKRGVIVKSLGVNGIKKQLKDACVNHCLSFEQVCDEIIADYNIPNGEFDTITGCKYKIPNCQDIGKLYRIMILDCAENCFYMGKKAPVTVCTVRVNSNIRSTTFTG
jgi:hypothetical protein